MILPSSGPDWLKKLLNEGVLDEWWSSLDYESKWAVTCLVARDLYGTPFEKVEAIVHLREQLAR